MRSARLLLPSARALDDGLAILDSLLAAARLTIDGEQLVVSHRRPDGTCQVKLALRGQRLAADPPPAVGAASATVALSDVRDALIMSKGRLATSADLEVEEGRLRVNGGELLPNFDLPKEDAPHSGDGIETGDTPTLGTTERAVQTHEIAKECGNVGFKAMRRAAIAMHSSGIPLASLCRHDGEGMTMCCDLAMGPFSAQLSVMQTNNHDSS